MKVLLNTWPWFYSRHNTDWSINWELAKLARQFPDLQMHIPTSRWSCLRPNLFSIMTALARRVKIEPALRRLGLVKPHFVHRLSKRELRRFAPDVILSHGVFPGNAAGIPVVWETDFFTPEEMVAAGASDSFVRGWMEQTHLLASRAAIVVVCCEWTRGKLAATMPDVAHKLRVHPFYRPYIQPVDEAATRAKHDKAAPLRVLIVGGQARRKGLPALVEAIRIVHEQRPGLVHLDVVSSFYDGPVEIPAGLPITCHGGLPTNRTQEMFRQAHVYAMPSVYEAYGISYVEAMAAGCAVIAPDRMPQLEILAMGEAGILVDCHDSQAIARHLVDLTDNPQRRLDLALAALARYRAEYHFDKVGQLYHDAFRDAAVTRA